MAKPPTGWGGAGGPFVEDPMTFGVAPGWDGPGPVAGIVGLVVAVTIIGVVGWVLVSVLDAKV